MTIYQLWTHSLIQPSVDLCNRVEPFLFECHFDSVFLSLKYLWVWSTSIQLWPFERLPYCNEYSKLRLFGMFLHLWVRAKPFTFVWWYLCERYQLRLSHHFTFFCMFERYEILLHKLLFLCQFHYLKTKGYSKSF